MLSLEDRRRRAGYRAAHRGTREMDWLLGRYADAALAAMGPGDLDLFERLLTAPDPELQRWIVYGEPTGKPELVTLILAIRQFHGLEPKA